MGDTIYIDRGSGGDGPVAFLTRGVASVYTGLEVCTEQESPLLDEINRLCGLDFFREEQPLPLYGVPCLCVFARDSAGGCFAGVGAGLEGAPIFYIDSSRVPHPLAPSLAALLRMAVEDPDWRCKCLPACRRGRGTGWPQTSGSHGRRGSWHGPSSLPGYLPPGRRRSGNSPSGTRRS